MKAKTLAPLALLTAALLAAALYVSRGAAPGGDADNALLLPEVKPRINEIDRLEIRGGGETVSIVRQDGVWGIAEMDGYPALFDKVKQTVLAVAELRLLAEKTADAALYHRLGVEDIDAAGSRSHLLTLSVAGEGIAALIVGDSRRSRSPADQPGLYARRPDGGPALLVAGRLRVTARASDWFEREILDIDAADARRVELRPHKGTPVLLSRAAADAELTLENAPEGKTAEAAAVINQSGAVLQGVYAESVKRETDLQDADKVATFAVVTFDGLRVDGELARWEGTHYALFAISAVEPEPEETDTAAEDAATDEAADETESDAADESADKAEAIIEQAAELNRRLAGWAYELSAYKAEALAKTMEDFTRPAGE